MVFTSWADRIKQLNSSDLFETRMENIALASDFVQPRTLLFKSIINLIMKSMALQISNTIKIIKMNGAPV